MNSETLDTIEDLNFSSCILSATYTIWPLIKNDPLIIFITLTQIKSQIRKNRCRLGVSLFLPAELFNIHIPRAAYKNYIF